MSLDLKNIVTLTTYEMNSEERKITSGDLVDWLMDNCEDEFNVMTLRNANVIHFSKELNTVVGLPTLNTSSTHTELWIQFASSTDATLFKLTWK